MKNLFCNDIEKFMMIRYGQAGQVANRAPSHCKKKLNNYTFACLSK